MKKLLLVFIFCLTQQNSMESFLGGLISSVNNYTGNIQTVVTDKLLALRKLVNSLVETGVDKVDSIANDVVDTGFHIRLGCTHLIQMAADETQKKIAYMVEDSIKDGKDASHCLRTVASDQIEGITNEMTACIEENILQCRTYVSEGLERIRDFLYISDNFERDLKDCGVGLLSVGCIGLLLPKIVSEAALVVGKLGQLIKDILGYILLFKGKFLVCQTVALGSSTAQFGKYVTEAASCIEKLARSNIQAAIDSYNVVTTTEVTTGYSVVTPPKMTTDFYLGEIGVVNVGCKDKCGM